MAGQGQACGDEGDGTTPRRSGDKAELLLSAGPAGRVDLPYPNPAYQVVLARRSARAGYHTRMRPCIRPSRPFY